MIDQLNNLIHRLTGSKRKPTMAELCYHGTDGCGNMLIAKAYFDADCGKIEPGCGSALIGRAYLSTDADQLGSIEPGCGSALIARAYLSTQEDNS